jgi:hypothetical protein
LTCGVFRSGEHATCAYASELTVLGVEQVLRHAGNPLDLARHIHDRLLYTRAVYDVLGKLDAGIVIACDSEFGVGPDTSDLRMGPREELTLGVLLIGQPEVLERSGAKIGYKAPFKSSG